MAFFIDQAKQDVRRIVESSQGNARGVISLYTAAFAVNFTDWLGKTYPWVRHERSRFALADNIRCESVEDHVGMLLNFARSCRVTPGFGALDPQLRDIRMLFVNPVDAGLKGLALCTILECTSTVFIPDLERRAQELGCTDFTYTRVHGEADAEHSRAFVEALSSEITMGYENPNHSIDKALAATIELLRSIYR